MNIERNPRGAEALYLQSLNVCFPGWGDERAYAWAFSRTVGAPATEQMLLREGDELLAGSAVSYRVLRTPAGREAVIGIMTGSWTLPAARGRGAFTQIIDESQAMVQRHSGALLLAFVTETNASFRRLEAAGSTLFPTRYVSSRVDLPARASKHVLTPVPATEAAAWFERFERARPAGATFHYSNAAQWAGQHLERMGQPQVFAVEGLGAVIIETHGDFDRLQALCAASDDARVELIAACLHRAQSRGKRIFLFESKPARAERVVSELGLDASKGYLTALVADEAAFAKLSNGAPLAESLADWSLDSGDRM